MYEPAEIAFDHLDRLTDSTGLIQHAIYSLPRRESGYTIDDNARALRLCVQLWSRRPEPRMLERITGYLSLLEYARRPGGGFHNLMSYQRQWLDTDSRGDCQGQAVRALAEVLGSNLPDDYRSLARELIDAVLPTLAELKSLRAQAYVILAYGRLWTARASDIAALESVARPAAENLIECYHRSRRPDWNWFESRMTYANAVMPHALFIAAECWPENAFLQVAEDSLAFLDCETTVDDFFWPVGNNGWYSRGEAKAPYDQQPVEAGTMAEAALDALRLRRDESYFNIFRRAHGWFHGRNSLGQALIDVRSGGCCDGLQTGGINRNQGAESTLAYLATEALGSHVRQWNTEHGTNAGRQLPVDREIALR
jgi:uncharacterized protein YyaL (SSP411 family)